MKFILALLAGLPMMSTAMAQTGTASGFDEAARRIRAASAEQTEKLRGKAVDIKLTAFDGSAVNPADLKGKVVLVDIWTIHCVSCIEAMPGLRAISERYKKSGFEVITLCLMGDEKRERPIALRTLKERGSDQWVSTWMQNAATRDFMRKYSILAVPVTWLFDANGMLVTTEAQGKELEAQLERLLGRA